VAVTQAVNEWTNVGVSKGFYGPVIRPDSSGKENLFVNGEAQYRLGGSEIERDLFTLRGNVKGQTNGRNSCFDSTMEERQPINRGVSGVLARMPAEHKHACDSSDTAVFNLLTGNVQNVCSR
jgi:hypothetical protein